MKRIFPEEETDELQCVYVSLKKEGEKKKSKARVRARVDPHSAGRRAEQTCRQRDGWLQQRELVVLLQRPCRVLRRECFHFFLFTLHSLTILAFPQSPAASICRMVIYFNSAFINSFPNLVKSNHRAAAQNINR